MNATTNDSASITTSTAVRRRAPRSRGFALLALVALLLVGSSLLLGAAGAGRTGGAFLHGGASALRLATARDALVAYSVAYPDLYGPGGAGPGHLPCPDTDTDAEVGTPQDGRDIARAGPNPPCGRGGIARGALPAHVTLASHRHGVDPAADLARPLEYAVSTRFVNNPLDRHVNGRTAPSASGDPDAYPGDPGIPGIRAPSRAVLASLRDGEGNGTGIEFTELMPTVERRVGAWLMARLASRDGPVSIPACPDGDARDGGARDGSHRGRALRFTGVELVALVGERIEGRGADTDASGSAGGEGDATHADACPPADAYLLEGIPQARHWFVRNGWQEDIEVRVAPGCAGVDVACAWRLDDGPRREARHEARREARRADRPRHPAASATAVGPPPLVVAFEPVPGP